MLEFFATVWTWLQRLAGLAEMATRLDETQKEIRSLAARVREMEQSAAPRPTGIRAMRGVYWGYLNGDWAPFCAACGSKDRWVPLRLSSHAYSDATKVLRCSGCGVDTYTTGPEHQADMEAATPRHAAK